MADKKRIDAKIPSLVKQFEDKFPFLVEQVEDKFPRVASSPFISWGKPLIGALFYI